MSSMPPAREFASVLIANRGEIALRIVRACRDAGLTSIAVHADQDANALFVNAADHAVALGGTTATQTYLDIDKLLSAAKDTGAQAVHPGYGFLAENADFAQAVIDADLVWIGPPPQVIRDLGDKVTARAIAAAVGAPLVVGTDRPVTGADEVTAFAHQHGLPVAIKAAFGGGGRGLRVVRSMDDVTDMYSSAVSEAQAAFGRGECFVEQFVDRGRHVEVQVLADSHGTVAVVGTRDCTLQRRHQKLVEEAPAPYLSDAQRGMLEQAAADICRAAGYVGAGTVEFLLAPDGQLSFLEVNTRLQVEHPVTEETADLDLVREQLRIAAGAAIIPLGPAPRRHAIEMRINAEDPSRNFAPAAGTLTRFDPPSGPGVRLDTGTRAGDVVSDRFDSLLAKLIVVGADRPQALQRARRALAEFEVSGVPTTISFLRTVLDEPAFSATSAAAFTVHTRWIEQEFPPAQHNDSPQPAEPARMTVRIGERWLTVAVPGLAAAKDGPLAQVRARGRTQGAESDAAGDTVVTPMQGTVVRVAVAEGEQVQHGDVIAVIEAMKMENAVTAPRAGRVVELTVAVEDSVAQGAPVCRIAADDAA